MPPDVRLGGHDAWPLPLHGACRCGRIRYQVAAAPKFIFACHCTDCQQFTASAFSLGMAVDKTAFSVEGETHVWARTADSGKQSRKFTCPDCAGWTHTTTDSEPDLVVVRPITLAEHGWVRPIAQIFTGSALPWALLPTQFSFEKEFVDAAPWPALSPPAVSVRPQRSVIIVTACTLALNHPWQRRMRESASNRSGGGSRRRLV